MTAAKQREKMALSRWWSWEIRARTLVHELGVHALLMLLVYIGWRKSWWTSFEQSPLYDFTSAPRPDAEELDVEVDEAEEGDEENADEAVDEAAEAKKKHTRGSARELLRKLRSKCTNTM